MELLYILLGLCFLVVLIYVGSFFLKLYNKKKKPKASKDEKPKEKKNEKLVYGDAPRPIVLPEEPEAETSISEDLEPKGLEEAVEEPSSILNNEQDEVKSVFDNDDDEDDFDEYKHFPAISAMMAKDKNSIANEVKNLSPELKAILISNILDKKDY